MDRQLGSVVPDDRYGVDEFSATRRPEVEPSVVVLIVDRHRVLRRVLDVAVGNPVLACRLQRSTHYAGRGTRSSPSRAALRENIDPFKRLILSS
jgi:hypothetical protein